MVEESTAYSAYRKDILMRDFLRGFMQGERETPRAYFAPVVALWRLLLMSTDSIIGRRWFPSCCTAFFFLGRVHLKPVEL